MSIIMNIKVNANIIKNPKTYTASGFLASKDAINMESKGSLF